MNKSNPKLAIQAAVGLPTWIMKNKLLLVLIFTPLHLNAVSFSGQMSGTNRWTYTLTFAPLDNYSIFQQNTTITLSGLFGVIGATGPHSTDFPSAYIDGINTNWLVEVLESGTKVRWTHLGPGTGNFNTQQNVFDFQVFAHGATNGAVALTTSGFSRDTNNPLPDGSFNVDIAACAAGPADPRTAGICPPQIISPPTNQTAFLGSSATFTVIAAATAAGSVVLSYQWQRNGIDLTDGANISGSQSNTLTLGHLVSEDAGVYTVSVAYNSGLSPVAIAEAVLEVVAAPPLITLQPSNQTVLAGTTVQFNVDVVGSEQFKFHWRFNGAALPGATNSLLTLTNVSTLESGNYSVVVSNQFGSAISDNALFIVVAAFVTTLPGSGISTSSALLNGSVTPGANQTTTWFEWGLDAQYGSSTPPQGIPASFLPLTFNSVIASLIEGAVYHYRAVASNSLGVVFGQDASFTTQFPSFQGEWYNVDPDTRDVPMVSINWSETNWTVHAWGSCSPTDCDWGLTAFYPMADSVSSLEFTQGFAEWDFGFSTVYSTFKLDGDTLQFENFTVFHDGSGRSDYFFVNTMKRTPVITLHRPLSNKVMILWPYEATNFVLQATTSCLPPMKWTNVTNDVTLEIPDFIVSGRVFYLVTDSPADGRRFYRLQRTR
jgi:hypothetical protein